VGEIDRVFSHPVALAQCRRYLAEHPRMESYAFYDTAGSVKQLVELRDRHAGAIASEAAAHYYGAQILAADIEDNPENFTRFFLVRRTRDTVPDPQANKISIAFSVENRPGSLVAALLELSTLGTNLTKIESRPSTASPGNTSSTSIARSTPGRRHARDQCARSPLLHGQRTGTLSRGYSHCQSRT